MTVRRRAIERLAVDTETTGTNVWTGARPFMVTATADTGDRWLWEFPVCLKTRKVTYDTKSIAEIKALLASAKRKKFFNAKFDILMLGKAGVDVSMDEIDEVSFMARAVNNLEFAFKLKPLCKKYLKLSEDDESELRQMTIAARKLAKSLGYAVADDIEADCWMAAALERTHPREAKAAGVSGKPCRKYAAMDGDRTLLLSAFYEEGLDSLGVRDTYEMELKLLPVTMGMEKYGVCIDLERMEECKRQAHDDLTTATDRLAALYEQSAPEGEDTEFNPRSTKKVAELLFGGRPLRLPVLKKTKTGAPKTDAEALQPHVHNEVVQDLLRVRASSQALKLFFNKYDALAEKISPKRAILHPGFNQWGTLTGRYSCSEPNMQQVSDPDTSNSLARDYVVDVRQVFVPREGTAWYCPDYSQIEVVIFADVSGEETMIEAIRSGRDVHAAVAEKVWGGEGNPRGIAAAMDLLDRQDRGAAKALLEEHNWSIIAAENSLEKKTYRKRSKSVTFTKIFGGGPLALMRWIQVDKRTAVEILSSYDDEFPTMVEKMHEIEYRGKTDGFVTNIFGRRLEVDPWNAYRAINHVVQSSAADLMKRGMLKCAEYLKKNNVPAKIAMTIHDELIFEFKRRSAHAGVLRSLCSLMAETDGKMSLPVKVKMDRVPERWSEKVEVEL